MIYLVGGAPRAGKSVFGQRVARQLNVGWVATDVLATLVQQEAGGWDATPEAIARTAEAFFPQLERFVWGISSLADDYLIEGVHFLPRQVVALSQRFPTRAVFLGCSQLTLERFEAFPGRSHGYAALPSEFKRQIVQDVPAWSELIAREAAAAGVHYVDTSGDFAVRLAQAEQLLTEPRVGATVASCLGSDPAVDELPASSA